MFDIFKKHYFFSVLEACKKVSTLENHYFYLLLTFATAFSLKRNKYYCFLKMLGSNLTIATICYFVTKGFQNGSWFLKSDFARSINVFSYDKDLSLYSLPLFTSILMVFSPYNGIISLNFIVPKISFKSNRIEKIGVNYLF